MSPFVCGGYRGRVVVPLSISAGDVGAPGPEGRREVVTDRRRPVQIARQREKVFFPKMLQYYQ